MYGSDKYFCQIAASKVNLIGENEMSKYKEQNEPKRKQ